MTRLETAQGVADQLYKAEDAIDGAIREVARLTLAVTDARCDMRLAAVVGVEVFDRTAALHGELAQARAQAAALHGALAGVRDQLRLRMSAPGVDKPPPGQFASVEPETTPLRLRTA